MSPIVYFNKYLFYNGKSYAYACSQNKKHPFLKLIDEQGIAEVPTHPPFEYIDGYEIVKCGKLWVALGSVICNFINGKAPRWFEIALSKDRYKLEIWKDLNRY